MIDDAEDLEPPSGPWQPAHPNEMVGAITVQLALGPNADRRVKFACMKDGAESLGRFLLKEGLIQITERYSMQHRSSLIDLVLVVCDRREKK